MSSSISCFSTQNLTEKQLQRLNSLLFSKVATLKTKIIQLEKQLENRHKNNNDNFDDFEIIDFASYK